MNLPLDIPALLKAATDIDEARNTPLAVSVYIDETARGDVVGHVRSAFASAGAKTRVTIGYLDDNLLAEPYGADDMAVIVAGVSPRIGEQAAHIRGAGIPVMVATTAPRAVAAAAEAAGWPVPEGDIVAPNMTNPTPFGDAARALARRITAGSTADEAPNAAAAGIKGIFRNEKNEEYLKISVVSPPEKGRANKELISFAAKRLKTAKSEIELVSGEISHYKKLLIKSGGEDVRRRLQEWSREYDGRDY